MKLVKKSDLEYKDGYLLYKDDLVGIDMAIVLQLDKLERAYQEGLVIRENKNLKVPIHKQFKFKSERKGIELSKPKTPILDKAVKEEKEFAKELKSVNNYKYTENLINNHFKSLSEFIVSDEVVVTTEHADRFDLLYVGDPTKLDKDTFIKLLDVAYEAFNNYKEGYLVYQDSPDTIPTKANKNFVDCNKE